MDETVVAFWERAAPTYETEVPYFTPMGERIVQHAHLVPGEHVLDVACGKGSTLVPAARAVGAEGSVIAIDIVPAMVDAARAAAIAAGVHNAEIVVMDGEALDFADARFDVVINAFGIGFLHPERALPESRRVVRDGGRLVLAAPLGGGPDWEFFGGLCERYGLVSEAHPGGTGVPAPDEMVALFAAIGFRMQPPVTDVVTVTFPDADSWWRWAWSHGQRAFLERLPESDVDAFKRDAFAALQTFTTPTGITLAQEFMVVTATAVT